MRITPAGDIGIGTTAPSGKVQISSAALGTTATNSQVLLRLFSPDTSNSTTYRFYNYRFADGSSHGSSEMRFGRHVDATEQGYVGLRDGAVTFGYGTAEKARIESNGNLLVGTTAAYSDGTIGNGIFQFDGRNGSRIGMTCRAKNSDGSAFVTAATGVIGFVNGNGAVGNIAIDGSATVYNTSSDYRLKENVDYSWDATTRLKQLKPARFNFKADAHKTVDGFLAHEVSSIVPEAITGTKDAVADNGDPIHQCIDQSKLVPLLVKTIQELEARITALEA